jgi:hypothetical protein
VNEDDALIERLRNLGRQQVPPATTARHVGAMASAVGRPHRAVRLKVGTAFFAGLLLGGTGLATAGALPAPAQDVAHTTLSKVGLNVPEGTQRFNDTTVCGTDPQTGQPFRNHGQYVKAHKGDPNAATSRCGKPIQAGTPEPAGTTKGTEAPEPPEPTEKPGTTEKPDAAGNPGKGHANNPGKGNKSGKSQGDQGTDNESPEPTDAPEPGAAAPKATTTTTSTPTTSTSTSTTSTTVAHGS